MNAASTPLSSPDVRTTTGVIGGAGWDDESYDDVLDLEGFYFVYVCVMYPRREHKLKSRKEEENRRKDMMGTVPLLEFSSHRASGSRRRQG